MGADVVDQLAKLLGRRSIAAAGPLDDLTAVEIGVGVGLGDLQGLVPTRPAHMGQHHVEVGKILEQPPEGLGLGEAGAVLIGPGVADNWSVEFLADLINRPQALIRHVEILSDAVEFDAPGADILGHIAKMNGAGLAGQDVGISGDEGGEFRVVAGDLAAPAIERLHAVRQLGRRRAGRAAVEFRNEQIDDHRLGDAGLLHGLLGVVQCPRKIAERDLVTLAIFKNFVAFLIGKAGGLGGIKMDVGIDLDEVGHGQSLLMTD